MFGVKHVTGTVPPMPPMPGSSQRCGQKCSQKCRRAGGHETAKPYPAKAKSFAAFLASAGPRFASMGPPPPPAQCPRSNHSEAEEP